MADIVTVVLGVLLAVLAIALVVNFSMWLGIAPGFYGGSRIERAVKAVKAIVRRR